MKLKVILIALLTMGIFQSQQASAQLSVLLAEDGETSNPSHFKINPNCEVGGTVPFNLTVDASNLCEFYHLEIQIHFACEGSTEFSAELESFGWTVNHNGPAGTTATSSVLGQTPAYQVPLNIPCDCEVTFSVAAVPNSPNSIPNCPEGIGVGRITLSQF